MALPRATEELNPESVRVSASKCGIPAYMIDRYIREDILRSATREKISIFGTPRLSISITGKYGWTYLTNASQRLSLRASDDR